MVRTKSDNGGRKAVAAKAPRKQLGGGGCSSGSTSAFTSPSGKNRNSGGNPVKWWPTPSWQKGVAEFFPKQTNGNVDNMNEDKMSATSSTSISPDSSCVPSTSSLETCNPAASSKDLGVEPIED